MARAVKSQHSGFVGLFLRISLCFAMVGAIGFLLNAHLAAAMGASLIFAGSYLRGGPPPGA